MAWGTKLQSFYCLQEKIISAQPVLVTWAELLPGKPRGLWWLEVRRSTPGPHLERQEAQPIRGQGWGLWPMRRSLETDKACVNFRESQERATRRIFMTQTDNCFLHPLSFIHCATFPGQRLLGHDLLFLIKEYLFWFSQTFEVLQRDQSLHQSGVWAFPVTMAQPSADIIQHRMNK